MSKPQISRERILSNDGREAYDIVKAEFVRFERPLLVIFIITTLILGTVAVYQTQRAESLQAGTTILNGRTFRFVTIAFAANLNTVRFEHINFTLSLGFMEGIGSKFRNMSMSDSSLITIWCPDAESLDGLSLCSENLPQIRISFPDGTVEYFNNATVSRGETASRMIIAFHPPTSNPWFTAHTGPQVAISINTNAPTDSFTLYVSS